MAHVTILVDNNSLIDRYFRSEPALSLWVQGRKAPVLLDTGYSDAFLQNALKLGLDPVSLSHVVLSHGHFDHTWGLADLVRHYTERAIEQKESARPRIVAHPLCLENKIIGSIGSVGAMFDRGTLERFFPVTLTEEPLWLAEDLVFLGEIPARYGFEMPARYNVRESAGGPVPDTLTDDSGLALLTGEGLVVVTGCAHRGICSTIQRAIDVTGQKRVRTVIGGFHLLEASDKRLEETGRFMKERNIPEIYPCHCVDGDARRALARWVPVRDTGSGQQILL